MLPVHLSRSLPRARCNPLQQFHIRLQEGLVHVLILNMPKSNPVYSATYRFVYLPSTLHKTHWEGLKGLRGRYTVYKRFWL
jgi:hypothetical protein